MLLRHMSLSHDIHERKQTCSKTATGLVHGGLRKRSGRSSFSREVSVASRWHGLPEMFNENNVQLFIIWSIFNAFASYVLHNVHVNQQPPPVWCVCCLDSHFLVSAVTLLSCRQSLIHFDRCWEEGLGRTRPSLSLYSLVFWHECLYWAVLAESSSDQTRSMHVVALTPAS